MRNLLIGAMIGAGVALLYAPASGARTRSMLRDKATRLKNDTTEFMEKKGRHLRNVAQGYRSKMQRTVEEFGDRFDEARDGEPLGVGGRA